MRRPTQSVLIALAIACAGSTGAGTQPAIAELPAAALVDAGVSEALAAERAAVVRDLRYELHFAVPAERREPIKGRAIVRLTLPRPHRLVFDFAQPDDRLSAVAANGRTLRAPGSPALVGNVAGHVVIPAEVTAAGTNEIVFDFVAGDEALNRNDEFLYTLFVPARAQLAFPTFDQPDLKGRYTLSLDVPVDWEAVANGAAQRRDGGRVYFAETPPLPTYLFAFAAGKFSIETAERNGRTLRMFHRETDADRLARNRDVVFDLHARALAWLEDYTAIPYPFGKFDFALIPSFQFSGMEHPGAVLYNQQSVFLDPSATQSQLLNRASLIAHETAHMWFGDLVTMKWFNDVWMKEVFANFMAAKIVNPSFPEVNHDLRFLLAHYPAAYQVDRTAGTNAIRQTLRNLSEAGQMYGPIIYQKAPIVMRQLEMMVGERPFREALREYLKRFAFGNATWLDLVRILDARTPHDVAAWSRAWVEERGRPAFITEVRNDPRGRVASVALRGRDPFERGLVWPQRLRVALGYPSGTRVADLEVRGPETRVRGVDGREPPLFVLPNGGGLGYGLFVLDEASRSYLLRHVEEIPDALTRGSVWVTLWDNLLERHIDPGAFFDAAMRALPRERDEQNAQRVLTYTTRVFWRWLTPADRGVRGAAFEAMLRRGLQQAATQSQKAAWFNAYRDTVLSADGLAWLARIWRREEAVPGLSLAEPDEITLALELAVREVPDWRDILDAQLTRTQNPDRKARFAFVMPALSADPIERERSFERFRTLENRRREPWVAESLAYLNHPLREAHARRFVRPALELLQEIQRTGDIFFPANWMESTLSGHRSREAADIVRDFLAERLLYPQRLRWTILSAADELFRIAH